MPKKNNVFCDPEADYIRAHALASTKLDYLCLLEVPRLKQFGLGFKSGEREGHGITLIPAS